MTTVRKHLDEIPSMTAERAKELETMPDEDIDYSDIPPLDETFFKNAKRVERILKKPEKIQHHSETQITVTLDPDVAEVFKTSEAVNNALRAILSAIPKPN